MRAGWLVAFAIACGGCDALFGLDPVPTIDAGPDAPPIPTLTWKQASTGAFHTCAIAAVDGGLYCWGRNDVGQLGIPGTAEAVKPARVGTHAWLTVSTRYQHTCAIRDDNTLWCWGENTYGQLGINSIENQNEPTQVPGTWSDVRAGGRHTCALDSSQQILCWGNNEWGALGDGATSAQQSTPVVIAKAGPWRQLSVGDNSACALDMAGALWCWGDNNYNQLGFSGAAVNNVPVHIGTDVWQQVATSSRFSCGVLVSGALRCWGFNSKGQLGDDSTNQRATPTKVNNDVVTDWVEVALGDEHTCARRMDGSVYCWGSNEYGQGAVPIVSPEFSSLPVVVPGSKASALVTGMNTTCLLDTVGGLSCAGRTGGGELGTGTGSRTTPFQIPGNWITVGVGLSSTCAIDTGKQLWCWGSNLHGNLGDGTGHPRNVPVKLAGSTWRSVSVGSTACATNDSFELYCWGPNDIGGVGDDSGMDAAAPVRIGQTSSWDRVSVRKQHACALMTSTNVACWGNNGTGESGQTGGGYVTAPATVTGMYGLLVLGGYSTCATNTTGVECWGSNGLGQLGDGTVNDHSSPAPVVTLPSGTYTSLAVGFVHACAVGASASYCWGSDSNGQFGGMTTNTQVTTPVTIDPPGGGAPWRELAAGDVQTCGIDTAGALWCMGGNSFGQLGDSTYTERHRATQVGTDTDWITVAPGTTHTCAIKTADRQLWCWGDNTSGQIGDGLAWHSDLQLVQ